MGRNVQMPRGPWAAHGSIVRMGNAGGFDVRHCPAAEDLAFLLAHAPELLSLFREVMGHFDYTDCCDQGSSEAKKLRDRLAHIDLGRGYV